MLPQSSSQSVADTDGSLWTITLVPRPLGGTMLRLVLYTDSQSCPVGWSSISHGGNLPDSTPFRAASLPCLTFPLLFEFPGTHRPNQLLPGFLAGALPKLTQDN